MTGCKIVLSSSWRTLGSKIRYVFQEADLPPIDDMTPDLGMNARAEELGCTNTHFNNTNGLQDDSHYTSAYDLALIARAFFNPSFSSISW